MHRTQLYLDEARYQYVVSIAKQQGISTAEVFRKLIDEHSQKTSQFNKKGPFLNVIDICSVHNNDRTCRERKISCNINIMHFSIGDIKKQEDIRHGLREDEVLQHLLLS